MFHVEFAQAGHWHDITRKFKGQRQGLLNQDGALMPPNVGEGIPIDSMALGGIRDLKPEQNTHCVWSEDRPQASAAGIRGTSCVVAAKRKDP